MSVSVILVCLFACLLADLSSNMSACLSVNLTVCLFTCLSVNLSTCPSVSLPIHKNSKLHATPPTPAASLLEQVVDTYKLSLHSQHLDIVMSQD